MKSRSSGALPLSRVDDDDGNENVTIELYHTVPLESEPETSATNKSSSGSNAYIFVSFWKALCCCCYCRGGPDFQPLTSQDLRSDH